MPTNICRASLAALSLAALSACATVFPKDFDPASGQSLLISVGPTTRGANSYIFRRIDRSTGRFTGDMVATMHYAGSYFALQSSDSHPDYAFTVMSAPNEARTYLPGEYALVGINNNTGQVAIPSVGMSGYEQQTFRCLQSGAPTFSMRPGEIVLVPVNGLDVPAEELLREFARTRTRYPEIVGAARVAEMQPLITFGGTAPLDLAACTGAALFEAPAETN